MSRLTEAQQSRYDAISEWSYGLAGIAGLCGVGLLIYQAFIWLKTGVMPDYNATKVFQNFGMDPLSIKWVGLRKIVVWLTDLDLWIWLILSPLAIAWIVMFLVEDHYSQLRSK